MFVLFHKIFGKKLNTCSQIELVKILNNSTFTQILNNLNCYGLPNSPTSANDHIFLRDWSNPLSFTEIIPLFRDPSNPLNLPTEFIQCERKNSNDSENSNIIFQELQIINSMEVEVPVPSKVFSNSAKEEMSKFPDESVVDFKRLIYNLLVENYNNPSTSIFIKPVSVEVFGVIRYGFKFNEKEDPEKKNFQNYMQNILEKQIFRKRIKKAYLFKIFTSSI